MIDQSVLVFLDSLPASFLFAVAFFKFVLDIIVVFAAVSYLSDRNIKR